jgi:23S rRNA pseudouridine1911/1915/1917 synthase
MPAEDWGWRITPDELRAWIVEEREGVVILNKPAGVVCHPSKNGPWSSLAGAYREYSGAEKVHMPFRLDRETSGVMLVTGVEECGRRLQGAVQKGAYRKTYLAVLMGELRGESLVALRLGRREDSLVRLRQAALQDGTGQDAYTRIVPLLSSPRGTLVRITPATGRLHQIRAHARAIGHPLFGDKIYGPDESLFVEFIERGWTERQELALGLRRQALHCASVEFDMEIVRGERRFSAPLAPDLVAFCQQTLNLPVDAAGYLAFA